MKKISQHKPLALAIIIVFLVLFNFLVVKVPLKDRALVLAVGVDKEGDEYVVTVQIILPSGQSKASQSPNKYATIQGRGLTMTDAINKISESSRMDMSFRKTSGLIVGTSMLINNEISHAVEYFFRNNILNYTAFLGVYDGKVLDLFTTKLSVADVYAQLIQKANENILNSTFVSPVTLKDYMCSKANSNPITFSPLLYKVPTEKPQGGQQQGQEQEQYYLINIDKTLVFGSQGDYVTLDRTGTFGFACIKTKIDAGYFSTFDENRKNSYEVVTLKVKPNFNMDNMTVTYKFDLKLRLEDISIDHNTVTNVKNLSDKDRKKIEETITAAIMEAFEAGRAKGIDVYNIFNGMYTKEKERWVMNRPQNYLDVVQIKTEFTFEIK